MSAQEKEASQLSSVSRTNTATLLYNLAGELAEVRVHAMSMSG